MSHKSKNISLILGFFIIAYIAYNLAFSKTIALKSELLEAENNALSIEEITTLSSNLKNREIFLDSILKKNNIKNTSIQNNLLELLNNGASKNNFLIKDFNEPHVFSNEGVKKTSYQFTISGDFNELLQVIYTLEQEYNFGVLSHVNFEKKRDFRKRKDFLECFVVIESFVSE